MIQNTRITLWMMMNRHEPMPAAMRSAHCWPKVSLPSTSSCFRNPRL